MFSHRWCINTVSKALFSNSAILPLVAFWRIGIEQCVCLLFSVCIYIYIGLSQRRRSSFIGWPAAISREPYEGKKTHTPPSFTDVTGPRISSAAVCVSCDTNQKLRAGNITVQACVWVEGWVGVCLESSFYVYTSSGNCDRPHLPSLVSVWSNYGSQVQEASSQKGHCLTSFTDWNGNINLKWPAPTSFFSSSKRDAAWIKARLAALRATPPTPIRDETRLDEFLKKHKMPHNNTLRNRSLMVVAFLYRTAFKVLTGAYVCVCDLSMEQLNSVIVLVYGSCYVFGCERSNAPEGNLIDLAMADMETSSSLRMQSLLSLISLSLPHFHSSDAQSSGGPRSRFIFIVCLLFARLRFPVLLLNGWTVTMRWHLFPKKEK